MEKIVVDSRIDPRDIAIIAKGLEVEGVSPLALTRSSMVRIAVEALSNHYAMKYSISLSEEEAVKYLTQNGLIRMQIKVPSIQTDEDITISKDLFEDALRQMKDKMNKQKGEK